MTTFNMLRNAPVTVEALRDSRNHPFVLAHIHDRDNDTTFEHRFPTTSRVSKALDEYTPEDVENRMSGGSYFFIDNKLVDFRYSNYRGFIHTDDSIERLIETIGFEIKQGRNDKVALMGVWSNQDITVPEYNEGGDFSSRLSFKWNPFHSVVNSVFELVRLICTNGMVGITPFLNTRIPLINRWEEHLDIASIQIQNKVDKVVTQRLSAMGRERATVRELQLLTDHADTRLVKGNALNETARQRLINIGRIASPAIHLRDCYRDTVFTNRNLAAHMPGHLTTFDVYNMATEIRTHTEEVSDSTGHALDRFTNSLVFDRANQDAYASRFDAPMKSSFSDPRTAFFGQIN